MSSSSDSCFVLFCLLLCGYDPGAGAGSLLPAGGAAAAPPLWVFLCVCPGDGAVFLGNGPGGLAPPLGPKGAGNCYMFAAWFLAH